MDTATLIEIVGGIIVVAGALIGIGIAYANLKNRIRNLEENPIIKAYQKLNEKQAVKLADELLSKSKIENPRRRRRTLQRGR